MEILVESWLGAYPVGGAMLARAAQSDPEVAETLGRLHGDDFVVAMGKFIPKVVVRPGGTSVLRVASSDEEPKSKVHVIRDIGSPEARGLRASEKRALLQKGQFIIDHRAEAETTVVLRSPESNAFQTCPGAGNWQMLTQDGELVEVETCLTMAQSQDVNDQGRVELWVVPLDGRRPFLHRSDEIYVRPSKVALEDRPTPGKAASREAVLSICRKPKSGDICAPDEDDVSRRGNVLVWAGGRAVDMRVVLPEPGDDKSPILTHAGPNDHAHSNSRYPAPCEYRERSLIFTGTPGRLRALADRWMIPSVAQVVDAGDAYGSKPSLRPGRPSDIKATMVKDNDVQELALVMRDDLISIEGAVTRRACSERDALLELVEGAGIHVRNAADMLLDVKNRPGVTHSYLLRQAQYLEQSEEQALGGLKHVQPEQTQRHISQDVLNEGGQRIAASMKDKPDDAVDGQVIKDLMDMADFREITSDLVRTYTAAMNESGLTLFRLSVHRDRYEEAYGEDVEKMEDSLRKAFVDNGNLALFMREKRGKSGNGGDVNSALAGMLTEDMG